jgi:antitoxin FitA
VTSLTIRKLDPAVEERLRVRAASHGRSMEEEARAILRDALPPAAEPTPEPANAFERLRRHFVGIGVDLELPPRHAGRSWDGFFDGPAVSDDFMRERRQPPTQERDES